MGEYARLQRLQEEQQLRHLFNDVRRRIGKPPIPVNPMGHAEVEHPLQDAFQLDAVAAKAAEEARILLAMRDNSLKAALLRVADGL